MTSWRPEFSSDSLYFITTSTKKHSEIFSGDITKQIVLDNFDCMRRNNQLTLFSFVIMPTHIHFIAKIDESLSLGDFMRNFKSLTANRITRLLKATQSHELGLNIKIWEDDYNAKDIYTHPFLMQKFDYIHQNPCESPWMLSEKPEDYPWSSARFYLTNQPCIIPIDDLREYLSPLSR